LGNNAAMVKTTLSKLAKLVDGKILGDAAAQIVGVAPFESATANDITVAGTNKFLKQLETSKAAAIIVPRHITADSHNLIQVDHPLVAFAKVIAYFHPAPIFAPGIHRSAEVGDNVVYGNDVFIGACAVIGNGVRIGDRAQIHAGVVIADDVVMGDDVTVFPNVTVLKGCQIGNRVTIHAGTVIGSDGFGFAPDGIAYHKIPHVGTVQIDDDVNIGANNTIDRATFGKTRIYCGVKTDNLVHIAHNVAVGENSVLVAQVGVSGSVTIGGNAIIAGQAGIAGHLTIGDRAVIGPQAGIAKDVEQGQSVIGSPAMPPKKFFRIQRIVNSLPELKKRLEALETKMQKIDDLEKKNGKHS
jgi:UDP-3-O-[3-hydroxymyristoyl] glucosamine N-acyltransferase